MSDEPSICLKEYIDARLIGVDQRFSDVMRSIDLARETQNVRLESMNEFRAQLTTQAGTFINRDVFDSTMQPLKDFKSNIEGRIWMFGAVMTLFNAGIAAAVYFTTR